MLFGLFWTVVAGAGFYGFAATWFSDEYAGIALGLRVAMMAVAATPFVGVAVWTLWAHAPLDALRARSTLYAVTDRRVLVVRPFPWPWSSGRRRSLPLDRAEFALDTHDVTGPGIEVRDRRQVEPSLEFVALADAAERVEELHATVARAGTQRPDRLVAGSHPADGTTP